MRNLMKYMEITSTWNAFIEVIEHMHTKKVNTREIRESTNHEVDIEKKCKNLAKYSALEDMGNGKKSRVELAKLLQEGEIVNSHIFTRLARHFYLLGVVEEKDTRAVCDLLSTLHAYLGNNYYYSAKQENISQLLLYGSDLPRKYNYRCNIYDKRMAQSALYLRSLGFLLSVEQGTISYSQETGQKLFDLLDRKIATIGGGMLLENIMPKYLSECYIPHIDRYVYGRKVDDDKNEPFNLLFQLSAKHIKEKNTIASQEIEKYVDEIIKLADAYLDICDIQGTSGVEYSMLDAERFPLYLTNEMVFDKICVAQQYSAKFILTSLNYLIKPWFQYAKASYSYQDYYKVAEYVLKIPTFGGVIDMTTLKKKTGISLYRLRQILKDMSIPANEVNREFVSLNSKINLFSKPIISFPVEKYFFIDEHFCGIGFLNAACEMISRYYSRLEREQGEAVEKMLRDEMKKKGYRLKYGKYSGKNGMNAGECDLVLDRERIVFMEIKKKCIADELDVLDPVTVLENMAFGMIRAQKQCFFHEKYLKMNGEINFDKEQQKLICNADQIPVYKISVCYPEYTFLTNKMFSMRLLEILLCKRFIAVDAGCQEKLDKLNDIGEIIRKCVVSQDQEKCINVQELSFYSLFCSMQQILTAVWWCDDEKEFYEVLKGWMYSSDKTLDPYISIIDTKYSLLHPSEREVRKYMMEFVERRGTPTMVIG